MTGTKSRAESIDFHPFYGGKGACHLSVQAEFGQFNQHLCGDVYIATFIITVDTLAAI